MQQCLCGDLYCNSCGPLQGNNRCYYCGTWEHDAYVVDDDDHVLAPMPGINAETGCLCTPADFERYAAADRADEAWMDSLQRREMVWEGR